jgi:ABC-type uncharacterized transport system permease subunit
MGIQDLLVILVAAAYGVSSVGYAANFQKKGDLRGRIGSWSLIFGWCIHSLMLVRMVSTTGQIPLNSQVLPSLCAWLVVFVYQYLEFTTRDRALGALIAPIVTLLHLTAAANLIGVEHVPTVAHTGSWFRIHVLAYILAYAAFAISCVSSVMYVMLIGEIQKKHLGFFYDRLPPLETLDKSNNTAASFGFAFLTGGFIASSIWAYQEMYQMWVWGRPEFIPLLVTWIIYAGHQVARWGGWRGKRAALLSIVGFGLIIFAFPVVGVFFSGKHPLTP